MDEDLILVRRGDLKELWENAEDSWAMPIGDVYNRLEAALSAPAAVPRRNPRADDPGRSCGR